MSKENSTESIKTPNPTDDLVIVGLGASAGGLEALQELISHLPEKIDKVAILVAQHLSPTYKSMLVPLLSRETKLNVIEAQNNLPLKAGTIFITPPDREISISQGRILLRKSSNEIGPRPSIDLMFESIAQEKKSKSIGILLSGTGSDGSKGVYAIKKYGGITIAQEPKTAKYEGMPISAIETGQVDLVLSPDKIGDELLEILQHPPSDVETYMVDKKSSFEKILSLLSERTGTDFSNYKPSTLCRRLEKRLVATKLDSLDEYLAEISKNPKELDLLFDNVLIGVTTFFRDQEAFEAIERIIKQILAGKTKGEPIRIWVPGCATGEEPYSMAILLNKLTGGHFSELNLQIFATDIDERAINFARKGVYSSQSVENLPPDVLNTYFLKKEKNYELIKSIRQTVLFSKHDLTNNPPFLKLDLISCRNLLIYFGSGLQKHIIPVFHYALKHNGYLFLGKSETVGQFSELFSTIDAKAKIFQRKGGRSLHSIKFSSFNTQLPRGAGNSKMGVGNNQIGMEQSIPEMVKETLYNSYENPYVVIRDNMDIVEVHGDVRMFLSFSQGAINSNILKLVTKELQLEMRSIVTQSIKENIEVRSKNIFRVEFFNNEYFVKIVSKPLLFNGHYSQHYLVIFQAIEVDDNYKKSLPTDQNELENLRIVELEQELGATKEHLQTFIEELETSNEELQSLNEELQSANEELQSSNEELETTNEELQSTNEELQIAYTELKSAYEEIEKQNAIVSKSEGNVKALLNNTLQSFMLVDKDYRIVAFNNVARDKVRSERSKVMKVGDSIIDYINTEFIQEFQKNFQAALKGTFVEKDVAITGTDGKPQWFKSNYTPVLNEQQGTVDIISFSLLEITDLKNIHKALKHSESILATVFEATEVGICLTNSKCEFENVNQAYCDIYGYSREELIGKPFTMVVPEADRQMAVEMHERFLAGHPESAGEWTVKDKWGNAFKVQVTAGRMETPSGEKIKVTTVTDMRDVQQAIQERNMIFNNTNALLAVLDFDGLLQQLNPSWYKTLGYPPKTLTHARMVDLVDKNDKKIFLNALSQITQESKDINDITIRLADKAGNAVKFVMAGSCISGTERIQLMLKPYTEGNYIGQTLSFIESLSKIGGFTWHPEENNFLVTDLGKKLLNLRQFESNYFTSEQFFSTVSDEDKTVLKQHLKKCYDEKTYYYGSFKLKENGEGGQTELIVSMKYYEGDSSSKPWVVGALQLQHQEAQNQIALLNNTLMIEAEHQRKALSKVASIFYTDAQGVILDANNSFCDLSGYSRKELLGNNINKLKSDEHPDDYYRIMWSTVKGGEIWRGEVANKNKKGELFWVLLYIVPLVSDQKTTDRYLGVVFDVSEQRQQRKLLEQARHEAESLNKLKSVFLANISHEIRTPLNGILGSAEQIEEETNDPDVLQYCQIIHHSGNRLLETFDGIIDLARFESGYNNLSKKPVNIKEILEDITAEIAPKAKEKKLNFEVKINIPDDLTIPAEKEITKKVVGILLKNAIKFTDNGTISLTAEKQLRNKQHVLAIKVTDTGIGFDPEMQEQIMKPFTQESTGYSRNYEGIGIGLAIAQNFIKLLEGDLEVTSEKEKGSTFVLFFKLN